MTPPCERCSEPAVFSVQEPGADLGPVGFCTTCLVSFANAQLAKKNREVVDAFLEYGYARKVEEHHEDVARGIGEVLDIEAGPAMAEILNQEVEVPERDGFSLSMDTKDGHHFEIVGESEDSDILSALVMAEDWVIDFDLTPEEVEFFRDALDAWIEHRRGKRPPESV
ncbi:hypothetical protein [Nocardia sp. NPDC047038]|uniref:hypothetical protein n=1 Tax=Nocardia sp. NPDC047038 TaxID=3154338 RepID=UPI0033F4F241